MSTQVGDRDMSPKHAKQVETDKQEVTWAHRLFEQVDISSLVFFRIAFGLLSLRWVQLYLHHKQVINGKVLIVDFVKRYYIEPDIHFKYYGFGWVDPWPGDFMYWHFYALAACCVCIALGLFYRFSMVLFFLGFTYVFLLEQARYLNHYYFMCLLSFLMIFIPANRAFSLDALFRPKIRSQTAPAWMVWILRFQFGVVYFYAGVAKLNWDWLSGSTVEMLMGKRGVTDPAMIMAMTVVGLLFDLCVVPLLLYKPTRWFALAAAIVFNVTNAYTFHIDIFPWLMLSGTMLFFSPGWPRQVASWILTIPGKIQTPPVDTSSGFNTRQKLTLVLLGIYAAFQLLIPLRHHLYPGDANWNCDGHQFAWRMLLREKHPTTYVFRYTCTRDGKPESGVIGLIPPWAKVKAQDHWQIRKMLTTPDMILQFAHMQAERLRREGSENIDIRSVVNVRLTGRPAQPLVDPDVNLAEEPRRWITPYPWVLPLKE